MLAAEEQSLAETSELQREVGRLQVENHDLTKALADASEVAKVCQQQILCENGKLDSFIFCLTQHRPVVIFIRDASCLSGS